MSSSESASLPRARTYENAAGSTVVEYLSYFVNEDDRSFPRVDIEYVDDKSEVRTYREAKAELLENIQGHVDHWRDVLTTARAERKTDVDARESERLADAEVRLHERLRERQRFCGECSAYTLDGSQVEHDPRCSHGR